MKKGDELYKLGVVDVLVPKGQGAAAVQTIIDKQRRSPHAHLALNACRNLAQPVGYLLPQLIVPHDPGTTRAVTALHRVGLSRADPVLPRRAAAHLRSSV